MLRQAASAGSTMFFGFKMQSMRHISHTAQVSQRTPSPILIPFAELTCTSIPSRQDVFVENSHSGVGASSIYGLLACRLEASWTFVGTGQIPVCL